MTHTETECATFFESRIRSWIGALAGIVLLIGLTIVRIAAAANGQMALEAKAVRVSAQGEVSSYWAIDEAGFRESPTGTVGYLRLKNISNAALSDAIFYAEYFKGGRQFCFSLVFSLNKSNQDNDIVTPGQVRQLDSVGIGLFPALEPDEVRLYLVQMTDPSKSGALQRWDVTMHAPVTFSGGEGAKLQLSSESSAQSSGGSDLILARINVDDSGRAEAFEILQSAAPKAEAWLRDFIEQRTSLFPATNRGVPEKGSALVLVRINSISSSGQQYFVPPRLSPWVRAYTEALREDVIPPVTTLVFSRPPTKVKPLGRSNTDLVHRPSAPPDLFELTLADSRWSEPVAHWVNDSRMPHRLRREVGFPK